MATTTEKTAGSSGSGMLIPFGPWQKKYKMLIKKC
jgi:hypothetical protein